MSALVIEFTTSILQFKELTTIEITLLVHLPIVHPCARKARSPDEEPNFAGCITTGRACCKAIAEQTYDDLRCARSIFWVESLDIFSKYMYMSLSSTPVISNISNSLAKTRHAPRGLANVRGVRPSCSALWLWCFDVHFKLRFSLMNQPCGGTPIQSYLIPFMETTIYIHTYIHTYLLTYIHTYLHTYIHTYINTYINTYIHTYILTYIHTYIQISI